MDFDDETFTSDEVPRNMGAIKALRRKVRPETSDPDINADNSVPTNEELEEMLAGIERRVAGERERIADVEEAVEMVRMIATNDERIQDSRALQGARNNIMALRFKYEDDPLFDEMMDDLYRTHFEEPMPELDPMPEAPSELMNMGALKGARKVDEGADLLKERTALTVEGLQQRIDNTQVLNEDGELLQIWYDAADEALNEIATITERTGKKVTNAQAQEIIDRQSAIAWEEAGGDLDYEDWADAWEATFTFRPGMADAGSETADEKLERLAYESNQRMLKDPKGYPGVKPLPMPTRRKR